MTPSNCVLRLILIVFILNGCLLEKVVKDSHKRQAEGGDDKKKEGNEGKGEGKGEGTGEGKKRFMADLRNEANPDEVFEVMAYINDVVYSSTQAQEIYMGTLNLLKYRWPSSTIPIQVSTQFKPEEKIIIWRTLAILEKETCIRFIAKREIDNNYVNLTKNHWDPIQSNLGLVGGVQNVNLHSAHDLDKYAILHLFLHTLGFPHQHIVPNRDEHVKILWDNISQQYKSDFIKLTQMDYAEVFKDYDAQSIMHYDSYAATRNGKPTILNKSGGHIRPGATLSKKDFNKLNQFYAC